MSKQDLIDCNNKMGIRHEFTPGQIVEWKRGLKNKRSEGPFIVNEVLAEPIIGGNEDHGSAYFREPLDIILGHVDGDGDFVLYHYDSRRFQPAD